MLVISIVSLIIAVCVLFAGASLYELFDDLNKQANETEAAFDDFFMIFGNIFLVFAIAVLILIFAITSVMGAFGLVCAIKNGRFSLICLVFGIIGLVFSVGLFIASLVNSPAEFYILLIAAYFGIYTASSAIAYKYRKSQKENSNEYS